MVHLCLKWWALFSLAQLWQPHICVTSHTDMLLNLFAYTKTCSHTYCTIPPFMFIHFPILLSGCTSLVRVLVVIVLSSDTAYWYTLLAYCYYSHAFVSTRSWITQITWDFRSWWCQPAHMQRLPQWQCKSPPKRMEPKVTCWWGHSPALHVKISR